MVPVLENVRTTALNRINLVTLYCFLVSDASRLNFTFENVFVFRNFTELGETNFFAWSGASRMNEVSRMNAFFVAVLLS